MCLGERPSTRLREGNPPTATPPNMNDSHKSVAPELTIPETLIEMHTFSSPILELLDQNRCGWRPETAVSEPSRLKSLNEC